MQNELLSIGKMAEMNHLTVATLRLYDELGLLHPRRKDPDSGYRYYDIAQNARLDMIAYMKELGMGNDRYRLIDIDNSDREIMPAEAVMDVKPFVN